MFDTVTFVRDVGRLDVDKLVRRGWTCVATTRPDGVVSERAFLNPESEDVLPRLSWYDSGYVAAEVSLPKMAFGENVTLLYQRDLPGVYKRASEYVSDSIGVAADVATWNLSRCDYCYCWQVDEDLPLYLSAIGRLHLSRHKRRAMADSCDFYSGANVVKFYDKHFESGLDAAEGVLRLEATVRSVRYMAERWLARNRTAKDLLRDECAVKVLSYFMGRLGMTDKPIRSRSGALQELVAEFGVREAERLWLFAELLSLLGSGAKGLYSERTFYRRRRQLKDAGLLAWHGGDGGIELPPLRIE